MIMASLRQALKNARQRILTEKIFALVMITLGLIFIAQGVHRFTLHPRDFGVPDLLGCVAGAFGAFFLLLVSEYVFHHAPLVFIPWITGLIYFAIIEPHFAVGMGLALLIMVALAAGG